MAMSNMPGENGPVGVEQPRMGSQGDFKDLAAGNNPSGGGRPSVASLPVGDSRPSAGGPPPGYDGPPPGLDATTGAMNMPAFARAYATEVLQGHLDEPALWYIDVRNFRSLNPKYGFLKGNMVLRGIVDSVRDMLAHDLPIARLGADRIIFVTTGFDFEDASEAFLAFVDKVNDYAAGIGVFARLEIAGGLYYLGDVDYAARDHNRALDYASIAHRNAKHASNSILVMFTKEDLERDNRRIMIEQTIDEALANGQVEVWYQAQVDYTYGDIVGAEALARWNHPELGWISPTEFIPVLENCGKVHELDLFVWEEACRSAGKWQNAADGKPVPISVNVSRAEMFEDGLMEHFIELQQKYNLPDGSLHLEVTESAFVEEADRLYAIIDDMRDHNMSVEMDDFGSGLSSLNMLKDVPVDVVKLDMGFMRSAVNESRGGVVLSSVIRMLQGLDTPIIAEGVETLEQAEMLKNMGCHLMQGFHFSRPMPLDEFEGFMASNSADDSSVRRKKQESHLEELVSFDASSSFLFNHAMGATMFFFAGEGTSESILVNDEFYEACGLNRSDFGNAKINPIDEIDPDSRATLWRAAAEAREHGAALCRGQVDKTRRWIDCLMRYLGTSARGDIFSLNIYRWGDLGSLQDNRSVQAGQDSAWGLGLLDRILSNGFLKCSADDALTIDYASPKLIANSGVSQVDFLRRCQNSFIKCVSVTDQAHVADAVREAAFSGKLVDCSFGMRYGFHGERPAQMYGRVERDDDGEAWLYAIVFMKEGADERGFGEGESSEERVIPFDYLVDEDRLVIKEDLVDGSQTETVIDKWLEKLDSMPENIAPSSASKVLAAMRDLRRRPSSGYTDIKCNLLGNADLRWYHVNYTCETDEDGRLAIVHGYAQDANDRMGSAKWWRRQAEMDQLTNLLNRNAAEQHINLAMRTQGTGMMFMIDLDGFKRVNDELGHLAGDALLREVASALESRFRKGDVLGRYGGDEFVAFVPVAAGDPEDIAMRRSQEVIDAITSIRVTDDINAGCSVGVAISHDREATFYELLEVADQAMYQSKLAGKGRYTLLDME